VTGATEVRVGRRVELTLEAPDEAEARQTVERLAGELFSNPLIETASVELVGASSSIAMEVAG
jgi:phosphoribosylformylglycinamidine synthase